MADFTKIAKESEASQGTLELEWLLNRVDSIEPKVIVEIGVHLGHSLKAWQDAFKPELLIGVDDETNTILDIYLMDELRRAKFIQADSHDPATLDKVVNILAGRKIDFLFIDGDHMYDGVKKDYEMYSPLVRKGGMIGFDDMDLFDNPSVEVYRFWNELKGKIGEHNGYSSLHKDSNGIGVLYV